MTNYDSFSLCHLADIFSLCHLADIFSLCHLADIFSLCHLADIFSQCTRERKSLVILYTFAVSVFQYEFLCFSIAHFCRFGRLILVNVKHCFCSIQLTNYINNDIYLMFSAATQNFQKSLLRKIRNPCMSLHCFHSY